MYERYRKKCKWLCGASFIKSPSDVQKLYPGCDAFVVGENLETFCSWLTDSWTKKPKRTGHSLNCGEHEEIMDEIKDIM